MQAVRQGVAALQIRADRKKGESKNMRTKENLQDVIAEVQQKFVEDGLRKEVVAEIAIIGREVEEVARRAQMEFDRDADVLQAASAGYQQTKVR